MSVTAGARFRQTLFSVILVYTWAMYSFIPQGVQEDASLPFYVATVAPAVLFILISIPAWLRFKHEKSVVVLLVLFIITAACSLARADFATLLSVGSLCAMLVALRETKVSAGLRLINGLFLLSILTCATMHAYGLGEYGVFPGQNDTDTISWRVSLFTFNVTPSWMFCLVVIGLNYCHNRRLLSKTFFVSAGLYFLLLSASRTGLIVLVVWVAFLACTKIIPFRERSFYKLFIPAAVLVFVMALNAEAILLLITGSSNPLVNAVLFKSAEGAGSIEEAGQSIERTMLWSAHAELFLQSPLIGIGTYDFKELVPFAEARSVGGAESFITGLFARIGLLAALFVFYIHLLAVDAIRGGARLAYALVTFLALAALAYGTFFVPYDFIFLAMFGAMNYSRRHSGGAKLQCLAR